MLPSSINNLVSTVDNDLASSGCSLPNKTKLCVFLCFPVLYSTGYNGNVLHSWIARLSAGGNRSLFSYLVVQISCVCLVCLFNSLFVLKFSTII